jgi:molecular chaperone GrpE
MVKLSDENNLDEIPVNVVSKNKINNLSKDLTESITDNTTVDELQNLLEIEKQKVKDYEDKIKHVLADYQNLNKKTQSDIEKGVNTKIDEFMLDFL